jgi:hypothetical protein
VRSRRGRAALAATLAVGATIALAACGGSSPTASSTTTAAAGTHPLSPESVAGGAGPNSRGLQIDALRFAKCMRSHGISNFPDPSSTGQMTLTGTGIDIHSPTFQAASAACQSLAPAGPGSPSGETSTLSVAQELALAKCMRAHGVSNFPDPNASGATPQGGVDLSSPQVQRAFHKCQPASANRPPSAS